MTGYTDPMPSGDGPDFAAWQKRHVLHGLVDMADDPQYTALAHSLSAVLMGDVSALGRLVEECERLKQRHHGLEACCGYEPRASHLPHTALGQAAHGW